MSRIAKSQPVSNKVYKHFAVVTVIATAILAMFADGAANESIVATAKEAQTSAQTPAQPVTYNLGKAAKRPQSSFGSDEGSGGVTVLESDDSGEDTVSAMRKRRRVMNPRPRIPGQSSFGPDSGGNAPHEISESQREAIMSASAERSGSSLE